MGVLAPSAPAGASDADALFAEGKVLMAQGRAEEACTKLAESERLQHGMGVRFHLARCREVMGKTASAHAHYIAVATEARIRGQEVRERIAREHAARLEHKLIRIRIEVMTPDTPALVVVLNGGPVARDDWAGGIAVDPGTSTLEAFAPEHRHWKQLVAVTADKPLWTVVVPSLGPMPPPEPARATVAPMTGVGPLPAPAVHPIQDVGSTNTRDRAEWYRPVAALAAFVGALSVGTGVYFGTRAISGDKASTNHCRGNECDMVGVGLRADATADGTVSTIAFAAGTGLILGAGVLWIVAPLQGSAQRARLELGASAGRLTLRGQW